VFSAPPELPPRPEIPEIPVLHLDEHLVVCDKPPGINVHRDAWSKPGDIYVLQTLRNQLKRKLFPVHRLDRATSGVLAFAFSSESAAALQQSLQAAGTRKRYLVLARGTAAPQFESTRPLRNENGEPQPCHTSFETLEHLPRSSLLRATLHSGRKHQIRRHLNHLAHHVIGDTSYGKGRINQWFRDEHGLPRMFLHAEELCFVQPVTGELLHCRAPLASDLESVLQSLRPNQG
jgi:tRNA pseudouridine65 synthase